MLLNAGNASADVISSLPQNASQVELEFAPLYDYDKDGCYATSAITPEGRTNPGLALGGDVNGKCRDPRQLENSNTYSRSKTNNGWTAIMYASYFEKDQSTLGPAASGHRHDWEHVVVWIQDNQIQYVSRSEHRGWKVDPRSNVRFENNHPKVVYHKDGGSTHFIRLANSNDEPPENYTSKWFSPPLVGWDGYPNVHVRNTLMQTDFGDATIKINDERFNDALNSAKPPGITFDAYADNSKRNFVTFFEDYSGTGQSFRDSVSRNWVGSYPGGAYFEDKISSVKLDPHTMLVGYQHSNKGGYRHTIINDSNDVKTYDLTTFNDTISSYEIDPLPQHSVTFLQHPYNDNGNSGHHYTETVSQPSFANSPIGSSFNDMASTVIVGAYTKVELFEHANYGGVKKDYVNDTNAEQVFILEGFHDKASSFKISNTR
ncbi:hypothetical protein GPJ61_03475 [Brevibacillus formosus]|uniref:NPP1 family protein n=1 Tax=Brevibacillus formosus TaxID=54913 RepID=UPI001C680309|nr:NPP1 family protein [Brevibacillus formosus]MBW5466938.1 hypothetical protein [Brevibacillus formosus]